MKLRLLEPADVAAAAAIVGRNYSRKYQESAEKELREMFGDSPVKPVYYVMEDKGHIIGFAGFIQSWMDYDVYQIFWVNVMPEFQRQGIGCRLVDKLVAEIRKHKNARLVLLTADASVGNHIYYKNNFGFRIIQKFGPKTCCLMSLVLRK